MANTAVHFSAETDLWSTPQWLFDQLNAQYGFQTDVCALPENAKCARYFTPEENGLVKEWRGSCWMNPPYGREIAKWIKKASESARGGATVVSLIPARTETRWWHEYIWDGTKHRPREGVEVQFLIGRLKFGTAKHNAPFPNAIVIFRPVGDMVRRAYEK